MHHYWKLLLNPPVFWTFQLVWIVSSYLVNCNKKYAMYKRNISTTLVLLLLIYSSTLQELVLQISRFHTLSAEKKNIFLPWRWTLTYDLDLRTWPRYDQDEPPSKLSCKHTQTHTQQTDCSTWTTKWSVNTSLARNLLRTRTHLTEHSWIKSSNFRRHISLVHAVEFGERRSWWKALLHQLQHWRHAFTDKRHRFPHALCTKQEAQLSLRDRATRACQLKSGKVLHKCRRLVFEKLWN